MSKMIKMTAEYMEQCRQDFEKALRLTKLADGKLNFTKIFSGDDRKATVYFTGSAWAKMAMLIREFNQKEVAWHGVAERYGDAEDNAYVISDIIVYPQTVSAAAVEMDTEEYAVWLMENAEDERFSHLRMQGHSHVDMPVSPSSVDLNSQEDILNMLGDEDFYIFMIWNKSFLSNTKIYDMQKNALFENADVTIRIFGENENLDEFLSQSKKMVVNRVHTAPANVQQAATYTRRNAEKPRTRIGAGWYGMGTLRQDQEDSSGLDDSGYSYRRYIN